MAPAVVQGLLSPAQQHRIQSLQDDIVAGRLSAAQAWQQSCTHVLTPDHPFELHQQLFAAIYSAWPEQQLGPAPVWVPTPQQVQQTNIARFMSHFHGDMCWDALHTGDTAADWPLLHSVSCNNPDLFWTAVLNQLRIKFEAPPTRILRDNPQQPDQVRWLPGACLNIAAAAIHSPLCPGHDSPAIVWAPEGQPTANQTVSWGELQGRCMQVAAAIAARFPPGAALAVALPLTVDAVVIYLSIILAGCVVVSIADSFAAHEVDTRLRISGAVAIFTQDAVLRGGKALPLYGRLLEAPHLPTAIVLQAQGASSGQQQPQLRAGDLLWSTFVTSPTTAAAAAGGPIRPLPHIVDAAAACTILFSSGTTGEPKAIPWTHTTPLRCALDGWSIQDIRPADVVCWPTNLGWMMGPWLVFASLLNGATIALYQGAPLGRDFGQFVESARVNVLGLVPSIVKAWRSTDCMSGLDWSSLRCFSSTGEASSPDDYHWLASRVAGYRPVVEYCGGTEIGGGFLSGCLWRPQAPSTFATPSLGSQLVLMTDLGQVQLPGHTQNSITGELALVPPLLGSSQRLLLRDHTETYYVGMPLAEGTCTPLRRHGDEVQALPGGYYRALGRCDDTMNLGGIKVSSVELERVVMQSVPAVLEAAAVGFPTPGGGPEQLHLFVVLTPEAAGGGGGGGGVSVLQLQQLHTACQNAIKQELNPLFKVHRVIQVDSLPRTASNKVMRRMLKSSAVPAASKM